jgi:hypothetical protein
MKYGQKLKPGDAHVTPRNIQEVQASKLWDAPRHPFFIDKYQVTFQDTIFLLLHILCVFLGVSLLSLLVFFCFVFCNKWLDPNIFILEKLHSVFHCQEHSSFHSKGLCWFSSIRVDSKRLIGVGKEKKASCL